ncbi:shikimate dehydrogenase [Pelistega sp. NLN82]|uniref:Shikimate dehydrogenase (NADP(+)) n=1 Tax=Pelistega ratti TaxID=2652177 RepID=A0A6L9Y558_9BURK|nr:shikimate dehydrogenase [Pelistega ratti]NEN75325.1 shikimate dehydrogenase [Pelistega ratti]
MSHFAVFGYPIQHSLSPRMHHLFAAQCGLTPFRYTKELIEPHHFTNAVHSFFQQGGKGLNITVPFKQEAFLLAQHHLTERAKTAGAVNTLWIENGFLHGDNTDGIGLVNDIKRQGISLKNQRILILGAGGATRGVILPLLQEECALLHIANRTASKAQDIAKTFQAYTPIPISASGLTDIPNQWDIIINASASSLDNTALPISSSLFTSTYFTYDMVYTHSGNTPFLDQAQQYGVKQCSDGLGMLVYQGAEAFFIWNHYYPDVDSVIKTLRHDLHSIQST